MADEVLYALTDNVVVITINRPDKRNALNAAVRQGLWDAWRRFEADAGARVAILTGAGDKAFCSGMDLSEMAEAKRGVRRRISCQTSELISPSRSPQLPPSGESLMRVAGA